VWMPLLSPLPEVPRLQPLGRLLFLFLQSIVPTVPASFLTFGAHPLYSFYDRVPRLFGVTALNDMQIAGVVMKIGVGITIWLIIAILFFRWYNAEEAQTPSRRVSRDLERELMGMRQP
jgi:putative membrane protein